MPEPTPSRAPAAAPAVPAGGPVHPLDEFYARAGQALPPLALVEGEAVPEPYRRLLVHLDDMTPTLETFHGTPMRLRVMGACRAGEEYYREVTLLREDNGRPVEFGAIKIYLDRFAAAAREEILRERLPLGRILQTQHIAHTSRPAAFFRVASDHLINDVLQLTGAQILYGRRNTLYDPAGRPLAEIVEILPPAGRGERPSRPGEPR